MGRYASVGMSSVDSSSSTMH